MHGSLLYHHSIRLFRTRSRHHFNINNTAAELLRIKDFQGLIADPHKIITFKLL